MGRAGKGIISKGSRCMHRRADRAVGIMASRAWGRVGMEDRRVALEGRAGMASRAGTIVMIAEDPVPEALGVWQPVVELWLLVVVWRCCSDCARLGLLVLERTAVGEGGRKGECAGRKGGTC
jgi:hypothetical protein